MTKLNSNDWYMHNTITTEYSAVSFSSSGGVLKSEVITQTTKITLVYNINPKLS